MDPRLANGYSAPTANSANLPSSQPSSVPTMPQTTPWRAPVPYLTMEVDGEDPASIYEYGINEETGEPYQYPPPPTPPFEAQAAASSAPVLDPAPRLSSPPRRRVARPRRPTTRQASTPSRQATNDRVYKTTDRHRNVSKKAHAKYRNMEIEAARALHGMVPGDLQSDEVITAGGMKEKMRAMEDAMSYIAALEEENRELRRQLDG